MATIDMNDMPCQCCGVTANEAYAAGLQRTFSASFEKSGDPLKYLCDFCQGLIDAGMLRAEIYEGELRYRQWTFAWIPGELRAGQRKPVATVGD